MTEVFRILVVCDTNVSRSPLAARHLQYRFDTLLGVAADAIEVSSAGVLAVVGSPMEAQAAAELERIGGSPDWFEARQLTRAMLLEADLVLAATRSLRSRVLEDAPTALRRTFTLRELAALSRLLPTVDSPRRFVSDAAARRWAMTGDDYDLADPAVGSQHRYREIASAIDEAATAIVGIWAATLAPSSS